MKACVFQPPYSKNGALADELFEYKMDLLKKCDETMDIIVLPEYSDVPWAAETKEENFQTYNKYSKRLLDACRETAKRCGATLFVNGLCKTETGFRNTTYAFDKTGEIKGKYFKKHLPPSELFTLSLDSDYTREFSEPTVIEIDGIRYGFLTCYDFYFYEAFANIARQNVDIIIGCSLQRSDTHSALEIMSRFCAYNCNAHLLRASVSFDENSDICGASIIVAPNGDVLANMKGKFGMATAEFDPKDKYYKPAGYGAKPAPHYEYIEFGRNPWQYRPGGSAIVRYDAIMPYPRICAHRGFSTAAPENSMPAFGAAISLGAQEIEFDLWPTKDGEIVSIHDCDLKRVSDGEGVIWEKTLDELKKYDFGSKFSKQFEGLRIVTFEEILKKYSCHVVMNIHVKTKTETDVFDDSIIEKIVSLIRKYDCEKYVYFMTGNKNLQKQLARLAPHIPRCMGENSEHWKIVDNAIELGCAKVQLFKPYFNKEMIEKAHAHGIKCNVFWSDDVEEAKDFLKMEIDTILTNDYLKISKIL